MARTVYTVYTTRSGHVKQTRNFSTRREARACYNAFVKECRKEATKGLKKGERPRSLEVVYILREKEGKTFSNWYVSKEHFRIIQHNP